MRRFNYLFLSLAIAVGICLIVVVPAIGDPVLLRYKWIPGEELTYKFSLQDRVSSQGWWLMTIEMNLVYKLTVKNVEGDLAKVEVRYEEVAMHMTMSSRLTGRGEMVIDIKVYEDRIVALQDGEPLSESDLGDLSSELRAFQELMKVGEEMRITSRGEIIEGGGYAPIAVLPEAALEEGDTWEFKVSLAEILPPGQTPGDIDITYVYTFQGTEGENARIVGSCVDEIEDVRIEGYICKLSFDLSSTALFNIERGYDVSRKVEGEGITDITDPAGYAATKEEITLEVVFVDVTATTWGSLKSRFLGPRTF